MMNVNVNDEIRMTNDELISNDRMIKMNFKAAPSQRPLSLFGHSSLIRHSSFEFRHSRNAFTLLELILAMFITCLLAVALFGSLWTSFKARDTAIGAVEPAREMQATMEMIGRDLQAAVPMSQTNSTGQMALIGPFEGEAQGTTSQLSETVEFYAITNGIDSNDPTQADGLRRIDLEITTLDDGTQALVENITPALPGDQELLGSQQATQAQPVSRVLSRNVASFSAQYSDGQNWYDVWDATAYSDSLPMSVQITIQMKPPANAAGRNGISMTRTFALPAAISINSSSTSS